MANSFDTYQNQDQQLLRLLNVCIIGLGVLCIIFIALAAVGYGTVQLKDIPSGATVRVNGHVTTSTSLRLRPGDYQLVISSPTIEPYESTFHINPFATTTVTNVVIRRNADAVIDSLIGSATNTNVPARVDNPQWFDNSQWLVGNLEASGNPIIVAHYSSTAKQWSVAYYEAVGYSQDTAALPPEVVSYVNQLRSRYVAG